MKIQNPKYKKSIQELLEFGILNIDKPSGPTSFNVSDKVRKILELRKTSHFGTLDPKVTGVLPIALNRACKLTGYFIGEDKTYIGVMRIHEQIPLEKIKDVIEKKFKGIILQTPPVKSRVKRQERERKIYEFSILEKSGQNLLFKVKCQGGTYIRKLIHDLGKQLGVGAHMLELRRIQAGIFKEEDSQYPLINIYDLEKAVESYKEGDERKLKKIIIPAEIISEIYPSVEIKSENIKQILTGKPIHKGDLKDKSKKIFSFDKLSKKKNDKESENNKIKLKENQIVLVFSGNQFIGIYKIINQNDIFAKSLFVMQPLK